MLKRIFLITALLCAESAFAQQLPAPAAPAPVTVTPKEPYDSTKAQLDFEKEKNLQLQANLLKNDFDSRTNSLKAQFQEHEAAINAWISVVRSQNNWDESYTWDRDTNAWKHTVKPAPAKAEPAKK